MKFVVQPELGVNTPQLGICCPFISNNMVDIKNDKNKNYVFIFPILKFYYLI